MVERYNPELDEWRAVAPMPSPRCSLGAAAVGGKVYAIGGQAGRATFGSADALDVETGRWTTLEGSLLVRLSCVALLLFFAHRTASQDASSSVSRSSKPHLTSLADLHEPFPLLAFHPSVSVPFRLLASTWPHVRSAAASTPLGA